MKRTSESTPWPLIKFKNDLKAFGLNPKDWNFMGPYGCCKKSKGRWQGVFVNKEEPSLQLVALWGPRQLLKLSAVG